MAETMLAPAVNRAEAAMFDVGFDVISYPLGVQTSSIVVDVAGGTPDSAPFEAEGQPDVLYASPQAAGETASETASRYRAMAGMLGHDPGNVTVLSDRPDTANAALELGMGVVHVTDPEKGLDAALGLLLDPANQTREKFYERPLYSALSYSEVISALCPQGKINVVGFVGRTGVGKSTVLGRLADTVEQKGGKAGIFQLDGFFRKSRAERKRWLTEPCISDDERAERENVTNWWDFEAALGALARIRAGERVHLEDLYDMERGGEKVGVLDIDPGTEGYSVFVEGTALLLPVMCEAIDSFVYLNAHDQVRTDSLMERNLRHGYTPAESEERKRLTDLAEHNNHLSYPLRARRYVKQRLGVLDNSARSDHLTLLPPCIPKK